MIDAALRLVTALADATVENADGVSVTLERHGQLMTVAASNDKVLTMDRHQYETGEGPCLAAKAEGRWYYIELLDHETTRQTFVPLALGQGIHSILSSPLMTNDRPPRCPQHPLRQTTGIRHPRRHCCVAFLQLAARVWQ